MIEISRDAARALIEQVRKDHPHGNRPAYMGMTQYEEYDLGSDTYVRIGCVDNIWWKHFLLTEVDRIVESYQPTPLSIFGGRPSDHLEYSAGKSAQAAQALRSYGEQLAAPFDQRATEQSQRAIDDRARGERIRAGI